ncbi:MAG TPA: hypothetical protein VE650_18695, partial [Acetobacteraceae bacterium]|nr:hypothetical protein [Acetobacteraceae bacterium]
MAIPRRLLLLAASLGVLPALPAAAQTPPGPAARVPAPRDAYVYIGWPLDGAVVGPTHIKVWFGTRNFGVAPAGV